MYIGVCIYVLVCIICLVIVILLVVIVFLSYFYVHSQLCVYNILVCMYVCRYGRTTSAGCLLCDAACHLTKLIINKLINNK